MTTAPVLIDGQWRSADQAGTFAALDPSTGAAIDTNYPVSAWPDCQAALAAADAAARANVEPEAIAEFLTYYAARIEARAGEIAQAANRETALPVSPRLKDVELPRTANQLRAAAAAARDGAWALPVVDAGANIRSRLAAIGPVLILGPNNFPLAFNSVSGGDFAAAIAAGNPVIAKGHPCHPGTTRLLAEEAAAASAAAGLPAGMVQLIYHVSKADARRMIADPRLAALAFTGSRAGGMELKSAADEHGKPAYLEMSSTNPVVILPGALRERAGKIADELADSVLAAAGQFCTRPGLVFLIDDAETGAFIGAIKSKFETRPPGVLLARSVAAQLDETVKRLIGAGVETITGAAPASGGGWRYANTLLRAPASDFIARRELQTDVFGPCALLVVCRDVDELGAALTVLEGNLTGCIYSDTSGSDDGAYDRLAPILRRKVGRLLNDKMPTGVAVSPAMNHGGPFPSTGHPGFTAVGLPASMRRFGRLECYDQVRQGRLPGSLRG